jgi:hypothetical protein
VDLEKLPTNWEVAFIVCVDKKIQRARSRFEILPSLSEEGEQAMLEYGNKIQRMVERKSMPPAPYLIVNPSKKLTDEEKGILSGWLVTLSKSREK